MQVVFCIIKKDFCAFVLNFDSLAVTSLAKSKTMNEINDNKEEKFYHRLPIQIRFNDVDRYGHVNNNAYFAYYDLGKEEYLRNVLKTDYRAAQIAPVIANINADFTLPIFYGDEIVIETRVSHVGNKSFTLKQRAINTKTQEVVCQCSTVMVCFDLKNQQSALLPDHYRKAFEAFEKD